MGELWILEEVCMAEWHPTSKNCELFRSEITARIIAVEGEYVAALREIMTNWAYKPDAWEHGFIQSISAALARGALLSEKQCARLLEILERSRANFRKDPPEPRIRSKRSRVTAEALREGMAAMDIWFKDPASMTILKYSAYEALTEMLASVLDCGGKMAPKIQILDKWYFVRSQDHPTEDKRHRWVDVWIDPVEK